ncbi:hypothetical protein FACS189483_02930 [Spirochaetia bacterium]|nr:hypothetical protein FACS189483_02930 [Spirochaetia bacterium]
MKKNVFFVGMLAVLAFSVIGCTVTGNEGVEYIIDNQSSKNLSLIGDFVRAGFSVAAGEKKTIYSSSNYGAQDIEQSYTIHDNGGSDNLIITGCDSVNYRNGPYAITGGGYSVTASCGKGSITTITVKDK